uniref:KIB1-4 beta-propeller domain-containing protein n=1 Tax=Ananas comosus var. bracteatus TaxID=296719 RepID=A0A6V7PI90_ANACO|nr:unnamed protein product [Ananas comosus var. bracteatus]
METRDPKRRRATYNSWSHFTTDILIEVASKHVTSAATYATLRGVCRSWRAALPATVPGPHRLPLQFPFLLPFFSRCRADDPAYPAFFSLTTNRTFALRHLADAHESICIGSCYGWLFLLFPDINLVLRNPVTGDTIRLPPLDGTIDLTSPDPFMRNLLFEHHFFIRRAILSSDPSADRDFLVALFVDTATSRCLTWGSGDRLWTIRDHPKFVPKKSYSTETAAASPSAPTETARSSTSPQQPTGAAAVAAAAASSRDTLPDKVTAVPADFGIGGRIWFLGQCNSMSVASTHVPGFEGTSIYLTEIYRHTSEDPRDNYTANIWQFQLKNVIVGRRRIELECRVRSIEGECRVYTPWPTLWWVPPNLHKKLGE